jgi:hypothetical protein
LVVSGTGFNISGKNRFRIVFLPNVDMLHTAYTQMGSFFERHHK